MLRKLIALVVMTTCPLLVLSYQMNDSRLSRHELSASRGGDSKNKKCPKRCDKFAGSYIACIGYNASCSQCGTFSGGTFTGSTGSVINDPNNPDCDNSKGYRLDPPNTYACGSLWEGWCDNSSESPTGYVCMLQISQGACTNTMMKIVPQVADPGEP